MQNRRSAERSQGQLEPSHESRTDGTWEVIELSKKYGTLKERIAILMLAEALFRANQESRSLAADDRVKRDYAVLSRALLAGASGQLRNKATTAGWFKGIGIKEALMSQRPAAVQPEEFIVRHSVGTDFALNFARTAYCARLPMSRDAIGKLMEAGQGFDVPRFEKLNDFGIWAAAEPPKGFLYNFPRRRGSAGGCDSQGIRCKMIANLRSYALTINQGDPTPMGDGGRRF